MNTIKNFNYKDTLATSYKSVNSEFDKLKKAYDEIFITDIEGIDGFTFNIRKTESLKLSSEATDYVIENNTKVQNHITQKPITITLTGEIGENVINASRPAKALKVLQSKLTPLTGILPPLTIKAQEYLLQMNKVVEKIDDTIKKTGDIFEYINNFTGETEDSKNKIQDSEELNLLNKLIPIATPNQKKAYKILFTMWRSRNLLTVSSDFASLDNCVITDINFTQGENTKYKSEIAITLKQLTFSNSQQIIRRDGRNAIQASPVVNHGRTKGISIASAITDKTFNSLVNKK